MAEHIQRFAQLLNTISRTSKGGNRAADATRRILQICDNSDDVPSEIETLLRDAFDEVARRG